MHGVILIFSLGIFINLAYHIDCISLFECQAESSRCLMKHALMPIIQNSSMDGILPPSDQTDQAEYILLVLMR